MGREFDLSVIFRVVNQATRPLNAIGAKFNSLSSKVKSVSNVLRSFSKTLNNVGNKMISIGKTMSLKITAPLTALGVFASRTAIKFEDAFAGMQKTIQGTPEEIAKVRDELNKLATTTTPAPIESLQFIAETGGQLGIATDKLTGFTKSMADLVATSPDLTFETAALKLAQFASITGMAQENFDRLASVISLTGNTLATTQGRIVEVAFRIAGTGKILDLTEAGIIGVAGALASLGLPSRLAGSGFQQIAKTMDQAISEGGDRLKAFAAVSNKTVEQFTKDWQENAVQSITEFADGMALLEKRGVSMTDALDFLKLSGNEVSDVLLRMAGGGEKFNQAVKDGIKEWQTNTDLQKRTKPIYETTSANLLRFWNNLKLLAAMFGEILNPIMEFFINNIGKPLIEWAKGWSSETKKVVIIILALIAVLGPLLIFVGFVIKLFSVLIGIMSVLISVFAFFLTPIGLIIAAIAALIIAGVLLWKNWDTIITKIGKAWDWLWDKISGIGDSISGVFDNLIKKIEPFTTSLTSGFQKALDFLPDWITGNSEIDVNKSINQDNKSKTEVEIKVTSDNGSTATIEGVKNRMGDAKVNVATAGYVGAY